MDGLYTRKANPENDSFIVSGDRKKDYTELSDDGVTSNDSMSEDDNPK